MPDRRPVLLTVSGRIPTDLDERVACGDRPRADYRVMQDAFDADVVDVDAALRATGRTGWLLHRIAGPGLLLAWFCFRHRKHYEVIVTDGEQVGLPLAVLCRFLGRGRARHMMIVHILSTRSKRWLVRSTYIAGLIDLYVVYCSWQRDFIATRFGVPPDRIRLSTFMVDTEFFRPQPDHTTARPARRPMICSAGLERRDYPTLMAAVDGLDVEVVIAAASPWSTQDDSTSGQQLPSNVTVERLDLDELRSLYAAAEFVVMPLDNVEFQAGITTILEAMAMGRTVVCTLTPGQTDTLTEGVTGRYVQPSDPLDLRRTITELLDESERTALLGAAARTWAVEHADVHVYAARLAGDIELLRQPERTARR